MLATVKGRLYRSASELRQLLLTWNQQGVRIGPEPTLDDPVSQLATQQQCESEWYKTWGARMREHPERPTQHYNRKLWEWVYILRTVDKRGLLAPGRRGLGFGVGVEPLAAVMADHGCEVVATDMFVDDAQNAGWVSTDQHASNVDAMNRAGICDPDTFRRLVTFRPMDMTKIDADLTGFDFCWSSCSLEHLGSLEAGMQFVENSLRCLRPGGVAVHTTEYNVLSNFATLTAGSTVIYRKRDILALARRLRAAGHEITLNLNPGAGKVDKYHDVPPYFQHGAHLKLELDRFVTTSIGLIVTKR